MKRRPLLALAAAVSSVLLGAAILSCGDSKPPAPPAGDDLASAARAAFSAFFRPTPDRIPHALATRPGTPWGDYVGSDACGSCHLEQHAGWLDSFHSRTLYDAVPPTVFGDFAKAGTFDDARYAFTVRFWRSGERFGMTVTARGAAAGPADTYGSGIPARSVGNFEVLYAFGNRRHQPYVTKTEDGRYWVLPVYWNDVVGRWMWDGWRPYTTDCAHCHVTGIRSTATKGPGSSPLTMTSPPRWTPPEGEGWAEGAVGCELCHGPGRGHVEAAKKMGSEGYRAYLRAGGAPTIFDPSRASPETRMRQCDSCHDFFAESTVTWVPGPRGYDREPFHKRITPEEYPNQFWPDGTDMSPCTAGHVFRASRMAREGHVECRDCHASHGNADWAELVRPLAKNALCLGCHAKQFPDDAAVSRHTHHPADGPGSLCHECHMPRDKRFTNGVQVMSAQTHSHAMVERPGEVRPGGPPAPCNDCHVNRDAAWTQEVLRAWKDGKTPPR